MSTHVPIQNAALSTLVDRYNALSEASLPVLLECYAEQARFKDPFNDVRGRAHIKRIFRHMYATLNAPRFVIHRVYENGGSALLRWDFQFSLRGQAFSVPGCTELTFDSDGRVTEHVDYWDPTETLWSELPVVGGPVRWLRRRFSSSQFKER